MHQHVGDAVGMALQVGVGPPQAAGRVQANALAAAFGDGTVEQLGCAVQLRRKLQPGELEDELGLLVERRQLITGKGVYVRAVGHARSSARPEGRVAEIAV